jgi:hypothetical protein
MNWEEESDQRNLQNMTAQESERNEVKEKVYYSGLDDLKSEIQKATERTKVSRMRKFYMVILCGKLR